MRSNEYTSYFPFNALQGARILHLSISLQDFFFFLLWLRFGAPACKPPAKHRVNNYNLDSKYVAISYRNYKHLAEVE